MKKILPPLLPALALLTLGGCATTSTLSTTENDGMYYSSAADRVTAPAPVASTAPQYQEDAPAASSGDVANPDYVAGATATEEAEYYDDDYYYASRLRRFHSPYRGIGMGYYDFAYTDPFWYGGPAFGYSPYSAWGGYGGYGAYDPFFSPWGYGGVNISIGFGRPWGWGRPWGGYGYGYNPYDRFGWGGYGGYPGFYGGGYGLGWGGYGNGYYGGNGGWATGYDRPGRTTTYGPRRGRTNDSPGVAAPNGTGGVTNGRRRIQEGGFADPNTGGVSTNGAVAQPNLGSRRRGQETSTGSGVTEAAPSVTLDRSRLSRTQADPTGTPTPEGGRRWRVLDNTTNGGVASPNGQPAGTVAEPIRRRRADYTGGNPTTGGDQQTSQPRIAEQPRRQRVYTPAPASEPTRTRTYEQPTRTYEQPTRSYSEPSRSNSNYGGGNSGGGNSGGSSSGGGRRRN